jgi:hypothetical protein
LPTSSLGTQTAVVPYQTDISVSADHTEESHLQPPHTERRLQADIDKQSLKDLQTYDFHKLGPNFRRGAMVDVFSCYITDKTQLDGVGWKKHGNMTRLYILQNTNCSLADCTFLAAYINFSLKKDTKQQFYIHSVTVSCLTKSHVMDDSHPVPLCASGRKLAEKTWPCPEYTCWTFATKHAGKTAYCPAHLRERQTRMSMVSNEAMYKNKPRTNKNHKSDPRTILPDTMLSDLVHDNHPYHDMSDQFEFATQPRMDLSALQGYDPYYNTLNQPLCTAEPSPGDLHRF